MQSENSETGTRDITYDLISVLYHALEAADTCSKYLEDAQASGEEELAEYFRQVIDTNRRLAQKAKDMLGDRLTETGEGTELRTDDEKVDESSWESFPASDAPPY